MQRQGGVPRRQYALQFRRGANRDQAVGITAIVEMGNAGRTAIRRKSLSEGLRAQGLPKEN